jgi:hypothetical protein
VARLGCDTIGQAMEAMRDKPAVYPARTKVCYGTECNFDWRCALHDHSEGGSQFLKLPKFDLNHVKQSAEVPFKMMVDAIGEKNSVSSNAEVPFKVRNLGGRS